MLLRSNSIRAAHEVSGNPQKPLTSCAAPDIASCRQGVILLIVVILLSLFLVVGLSFVLYAESEATASRIYREAFTINYDRADIPADELLKWALGQAIFDVADVGDGVYSAMRGHSLARSMFGWNDPATTPNPNVNNNTVAFNGIGRIDGAFMGLPAELAGQSVGNLVNHTYFPTYLPGGQIAPQSYIRDPERAGVRTAGATGGLQLPYAPINPANQPYAGGWNVPYTFPDKNNVYLAALKANDGGTPRVMMQSFHRAPPGTPFYVANPNPLTLTNSAPWLNTTNAALKYMVLRPRPVDMYWGGPNDPHSFPLPASDTGDVQNLPGGVGYDSFWMDLGYPVQATRGGRKFKPLFAFLIVDLDGRVNVNVHGNIKLDGSGGPSLHASNQGIGKHEVNLEKVFTQNPAELRNLFVGNSSVTPAILGRYGDGTPAGTGQPGKPGVGLAYPDPYAVNPPYPAPKRTFLAPADWDATDDNVTAQITQRFSLPAGYLTFPMYTAGYDALSSVQSLTNNPLLCNVLNAKRDAAVQADQPLLLAENLYYLIGSAVGPNHERAALFNLMKNASTSVSSNLALPRIRHMLTTHSYDLDTPGAMPWITNPSISPYSLPDGAPHPTSSGQFTLTAVPSAISGLDFNQNNNQGGRCRILPRLDMNRKLAPYPTNPADYQQPNLGSPPNGSTAPLPTQTYYRAVWERQNFARDIFDRLIQVTGANTAAAVDSPEFNALRYLAQLAVNIVDYIDDDEFSTPFAWYPLGGGVNFGNPNAKWVFGVESPKVVLNEVYAEIRNNVGDEDPINGAQQPYKVNFWVELFNTHKQAQNPSGAPFPVDLVTGLTNPADELLERAGSSPIYRIQIFNDQNFNTQDLTRADNVTGMAGTQTAPVTAKCQTGAWFNAGFTNTAGADTRQIKGNNGSASCNPGDNVGFYVVGPDNPPIEGASPVPQATNQLVTTPGSPNTGLSYDEPLNGPNVPRRAHTLLLQKLVSPYLPFDDNPASPTYNPYVTVDYMTGVTPNDAVRAHQAMPGDHTMSGYTAYASRSTVGRGQPMSATSPISTASMTPHSFHNHNSQSPQFDWLVHLNRPPVSPMELLQVSPFKPHEITHAFAGRTDALRHTRQWVSDDTRVYRVFEYLACGDRGNLTHVIPGRQTQQPSTFGRTAGRININTVWDREVFNALTDAQQQANYFNEAQDVNAAWNAIQLRRTIRLQGTGSSTDDLPYVGYATPATPNNVLNNQQIGSAGTPLHNTEFGYSTIVAPPLTSTSTPEYIKREMLTKIANSIGVRSNVFAIYLTVGFFEVIDDTVRPVKLGAEIRTRNGIPIRHKMFSVVDRTQLAIDPAATPGVLAASQPNKTQFFVTSQTGVSAEEIISPSGGGVKLEIVGGMSGTMYYDGQPVTIVSAGPPYGPNQFWMYADVGVKQEKVLCQIDPNDGNLIVAIGGPNGLQQPHAPGFPLSYLLPGNPGPQGRINYNDPQYKKLIPYTTIIQ